VPEVFSVSDLMLLLARKFDAQSRVRARQTVASDTRRSVLRQVRENRETAAILCIRAKRREH